MGGEQLRHGCLTLLERLSQRRGIEDEIADLAPHFGGITAPHDRDGALELLAADPQFAIERSVGQSPSEPLGSDVTVAIAGEELLAVPIRADTIQFLAEPCRSLNGVLAATPPRRAISTASPRYWRRCLQVRWSIGSDWFRHAGHEHEYTPPTFLS